MAHKIDFPGAGPGAAAGEPSGKARPHQFGLTAAMAPIVGSIGVGILNWAPFFLVAGALLPGIPVYLAQRRHLTRPPAMPPYPRGGVTHTTG